MEQENSPKRSPPQRYDNLESAGIYSLLTPNSKFPILQSKRELS